MEHFDGAGGGFGTPLTRRSFLTHSAVGLVAVTGLGELGRSLVTFERALAAAVDVPWNTHPTEPDYATLSRTYALEPQALAVDEEAARQALVTKMQTAVATYPPRVKAVDRTHADFAAQQNWFSATGDLVLGWLACYSTDPSVDPGFVHMYRQHPHAVFMLGDNGYLDGNLRLNRGTRPPLYFTPREAAEADVLQAFVTKSFLQTVRGPAFCKLKTDSMIYAVQDDHDYLADGQTLFTIDLNSLEVELAMHSPSLQPARQAFGSVFTQIGVYPTPTYFSTDIGSGVQVTCLNSREYAYQQLYDVYYDNHRFPAFLGPNQWAWFEDVIVKAPNDLHLVFLPVSPTFSRNSAGGSQISTRSRNTFYDFLGTFPQKRFAVFTGDRHACGLAQFANVTEISASPSGVHNFPTVNLSDTRAASRLWSNGTNTGDPSIDTMAFGVARLTATGGLTVEFRRSVDGSTIASPYGDPSNQIRVW